MKPFEERWQECLRQARKVPPRDTRMPLGFQRRVLRGSVAGEVEPDAWIALWLRFGLRTLGVVTLLLFLALAYTRTAPAPASSLRPPLENSIPQYKN